MLDLIGRAPTPETEMVADTGCHARVKALEDSAWKSRISEKEQKACARWHGDDAARRYNNRARLKRPARLSNCAPKRSLRPHPRHRRPAPHRAARCRERREALPGRGPQPGTV